MKPASIRAASARCTRARIFRCRAARVRPSPRLPATRPTPRPRKFTQICRCALYLARDLRASRFVGPAKTCIHLHQKIGSHLAADFFLPVRKIKAGPTDLGNEATMVNEAGTAIRPCEGMPRAEDRIDRRQGCDHPGDARPSAALRRHRDRNRRQPQARPGADRQDGFCRRHRIARPSRRRERTVRAPLGRSNRRRHRRGGRPGRTREVRTQPIRRLQLPCERARRGNYPGRGSTRVPRNCIAPIPDVIVRTSSVFSAAFSTFPGANSPALPATR